MRLKEVGRQKLDGRNTHIYLSGFKTLPFAVEFSQLRSCVKVEAAVLDFPSLTVLMVSVDVKQHWT